MKTYLIKRSTKNESFLKIGFTSLEDVLKRHDFGDTLTKDSNSPLRNKVEMILKGKKYIPNSEYDWIPIHTENFEYEGQAKLLEKMVLDEFQDIKYTPKQKYSGYSECFIHSDENETKIKNYMAKQAELIKAETPGKLHYALIQMKIRKDDPIEKHLEVVKRWKAQQKN